MGALGLDHDLLTRFELYPHPPVTGGFGESDHGVPKLDLLRRVHRFGQFTQGEFGKIVHHEGFLVGKTEFATTHCNRVSPEGKALGYVQGKDVGYDLTVFIFF